MNSKRAGSSPLGLVALSLVLAGIVACDRATSSGGGAGQAGSNRGAAQGRQYPYVPAPAVGTYPSANATIQTWIAVNNTQAIRAHAWDIWASITSRISGTDPQDTVPTWQTWYSGHELFDTGGFVHVNARARRGVVQFGVRRELTHPSVIMSTNDGKIPYVPDERVFAFNRFTKSTAEFIWDNGLNQARVLRDTNIAFNRRRTPLVSRAILTSKDSTDSSSFVLKPVYQFISGTEVTAVPYWDGDSSAATTDSANPIASTWRHAIAVDPTNKYKDGDSVYLPVNNEQPSWLKIRHLSDFYWIRITKEDSIKFTMFGAENGDFIGLANDTSLQAVLNAVRPGNIGLLMAMHVTGKEIPNWTWQSYWWAIDPQDSTFGADRPKNIPRPWNHYNMTTTYMMVDPKTRKPVIGFNPYLETSLAGKIPKGPGPAPDSTSWTGVTTNCMACHRRAAIAWVDTVPVPQLYGPAMQVNAGDPVVFTQPFRGYVGGRVPLLTTDFLWSVAIRWKPLPKRASASDAPKH